MHHAATRRSHKTKRIRDAAERARLCRIARALQEREIGADWPITRNIGSLTLRNPADRREVVTVFIDVGNSLARATGRTWLHGDPTVVAVTVCALPRFVRDAVRAGLRSRFGHHYADPENENDTEYKIMPGGGGHYFDLIFLPPGDECPIEDEAYLAALIEATEWTPDGRGVRFHAPPPPDRVR